MRHLKLSRSHLSEFVRVKENNGVNKKVLLRISECASCENKQKHFRLVFAAPSRGD